MKAKILIAVLAGIFSFGHLRLDTEKSSLKVTGTSSLHDWEMKVTDFDASGSVSENLVENLVVTVKSKSLESGKSIMDDKAYDALQADDYTKIQFSAKKLQIDGGKVSGKGSLTIADKSNELDFNAKILSKEGNKIHLQGSIPLKMTDFDITPPTAMFGTLKTGDEVEIHYNIFISY